MQLFFNCSNVTGFAFVQSAETSQLASYFSQKEFIQVLWGGEQERRVQTFSTTFLTLPTVIC
jgi:hypothetical protein